MQRLEVSDAVRPLKPSLGVKGLNLCPICSVLNIVYIVLMEKYAFYIR